MNMAILTEAADIGQGEKIKPHYLVNIGQFNMDEN